MKDYKKMSMELHRKHKGKIGIVSKMEVKNKEQLSVAYTPGVAGPSEEIAKDKELAKVLTSGKNMVAVISDGSAVLGLGNIGPEAALPVMEGKAILMKEFAGVDAFPIVLDTQDTEKIVEAVTVIAPSFGAVNLEDISAPRCFEVEKKLQEKLSIPIFHDDQHGTAIVVLAGLINALKVVGKEKESVRVVINGVGAAGTAVAKLLVQYGMKNIALCDSSGVINKNREGTHEYKKELVGMTESWIQEGTVHDAIVDADVFIGVSKGGLLDKKDIEAMNKDAIIFAMANPYPEIMPDEAKAGGAAVVATGRSDFPNQINNVLVFPGVFKGLLELHIPNVTAEMKYKAAEALAAVVKNPSAEEIIPDPFESNVADTIAKSIIETYRETA